jgi:mRNA interferase HigB
MKVRGEAEVAAFARKHAASRRALQRFVEVASAADWPHFPAVKQTFGSADYAPFTGTLIFDIGENKYRLVARVDFDQQLLFIERIRTYEEYGRENL